MLTNQKTTCAAIAYVVGKTLQHVQTGPAWLYSLGEALEYVALASGLIVAKDATTRNPQ